MNRRDIISTLSLMAIGSLFTNGAYANPKKKPNVLFITIDDLRPQLYCYGYTQMITPNFDRVADNGVVFTNHYV